MTTALHRRRSSPARATWFELACFGVTALALVAASELAGWLTFWPAVLVSVVGVAGLAWCEPAVFSAAGSWHRRRLWIVLAVALLSLSRAVSDELAQAAIWLPLATAVTLRVVPRQRIVRVTDSAQEKAAPATPLAIEPSHGDADRHHHIEHVQSFDARGLRRVTGVARLTFQAGERQIDVHLAFCPSFAAAPRLDCHQTSGPNARIKLAQVMPYGAKLEVQRAEAGSWAVVVIDFTAKVADEQPSEAMTRKAS